jgi:Zn-dependent protease
VHELSHYLMSKRHGLDASLPYFIPSIPPFGTFGAFISMRDPMPSRKALVQIGAAGPLGGLAVTIPVALIGLFLTAQGHAVDGPIGDAGVLGIIIQPLYQLLTMLIPMADNMALHPTAFAAWVGFLVTAINLLPIGQLDGGHVARGLLGDKAKYLGYAAFGALVFMALFFDGWILFALLVFFMGVRHPAPLNDISKLDLRTMAMGILAMVVLLATFVPQPMVAITPDHSFDMSVAGGNNTTAAPGWVEFQILVNNTGNANTVLVFTLQNSSVEFSAFFWSNGTVDTLEVPLPYESNTTITVRVYVSSSPSEMQKDIQLTAVAKNASNKVTQTLTVHVA